jgi:hypothetical protein
MAGHFYSELVYIFSFENFTEKMASFLEQHQGDEQSLPRQFHGAARVHDMDARGLRSQITNHNVSRADFFLQPFEIQIQNVCIEEFEVWSGKTIGSLEIHSHHLSLRPHPSGAVLGPRARVTTEIENAVPFVDQFVSPVNLLELVYGPGQPFFVPSSPGKMILPNCSAHMLSTYRPETGKERPTALFSYHILVFNAKRFMQP